MFSRALSSCIVSFEGYHVLLSSFKKLTLDLNVMFHQFSISDVEKYRLSLKGLFAFVIAFVWRRAVNRQPGSRARTRKAAILFLCNFQYSYVSIFFIFQIFSFFHFFLIFGIFFKFCYGHLIAFRSIIYIICSLIRNLLYIIIEFWKTYARF